MPAIIRKHVFPYPPPPRETTPDAVVAMKPRRKNGWSETQEDILRMSWPPGDADGMARLCIKLGKKRGAIAKHAVKLGLRRRDPRCKPA